MSTQLQLNFDRLRHKLAYQEGNYQEEEGLAVIEINAEFTRKQLVHLRRNPETLTLEYQVSFKDPLIPLDPQSIVRDRIPFKVRNYDCNELGVEGSSGIV